MSYVGLSKKSTFNDRYRNGKWWLRTHNKYLQRAANKYGIDKFTISTLEDNIENEDELAQREIFWINEVDCYYPKGYNFPFPNVVEVDGKTYKIKNIKTGEIFEITNLTKFCRNNKIGCKAMSAMLVGVTLRSHGYCLPETEVLSTKQTLKNPVILENITTGEKVKIINLTEFCRKYNLKYMAVSRIVHRYYGRKTHKGWRLEGEKREGRSIHKNLYFYSPDGECIFIENLYTFCKENGICYEGMLSVANGKHLQHKGWKLLKNKGLEQKIKMEECQKIL